MMPTSIKGAMGTPVVSDLITAVGKTAVSRLIEVEVVKLAAALSVGSSLDNYKVQLIATQMVEFFPNESIGDFKACFFRASAGQYGDIFRLDGIVVRKFMEKYLDEKYETVEQQLMKEKDNLYKSPDKPEPSDFNVYKEFLKVHGAGVGQKVPGLTREDVLRNGQSEPPKKKSTGHPPTSDEYFREWQSKQVEHRRKFLKDKYPNATDEEINEMI